MKELFASKSIITSALFDILDAGDKGEPWIFAQDESDEETERRYRFANAVVSAIEDLQANFKFPKLQDLCNRHIRESLPHHSSNVCSACEAERLISGVERRRRFEEREDYERLKAQFEGKSA